MAVDKDCISRPPCMYLHMQTKDVLKKGRELGYVGEGGMEEKWVGKRKGG